MRRMLKSKIHRATVTQADLHYEGSLSIDRTLMRQADILPYEEVHIWNVSRGTRLTTYALEAPHDSGVICVNGAAAHLVGVEDIIIIASFCDMAAVPENYDPIVVHVDRENRCRSLRQERPGPETVSAGAEM
jgi:aspartate 1-decarboxylase